MIKIKSDKIIVKESIFDGYLYLDGNKIVKLSETDDCNCESYDYTGKYVSAGFIDIHTHGAGGYGFLTNDESDVINGCNFMLKYGTTTVFPTISASSFTDMKNSLISVKNAKNSGKILNNMAGAHLEGPYLSQNQSGAQNLDFITNPIESDYKCLAEEYGNYIARWTYAPEHDVGGKFCKYITENNIVASAGHSDAKYKDMVVAIENGCNLVTHLYSCTSTVTRDKGFRSLGVIESAYLRDELNVEIIADGKHLPLELIQMIIKIKGSDKVALVTDSLSLAGSDVKEGTMSGIEFVVENGVCRLKDRTAFAGSIATANTLIKTLLNCGYSIETAVKMLTEVPAKIMHLNKGVIDVGYDADIIVFDDNVNVLDAFIMGKKII